MCKFSSTLAIKLKFSYMKGYCVNMFTKYIEEKYKVEGLNLDITKGEIKQVSKFRDH